MVKDDITSPAQPFLYHLFAETGGLFTFNKKKKARFHILKTYETLLRAADPLRRDQRIQIYHCEFMLELTISISFVSFDLQQKVKSRFDLGF